MDKLTLDISDETFGRLVTLLERGLTIRSSLDEFQIRLTAQHDEQPEIDEPQVRRSW